MYGVDKLKLFCTGTPVEINPGGGGGRIRMSHEYHCSFVNIVACISLCNTIRKKVYLDDLCSN